MTRALVVDDREENRYLLCSLLTGHGFDVSVADNGAQALLAARQKAPDVIISDLLMPVMDGYSLLREWKADATLSPIPFIVYTATYTEPKDERLALDLGADAFMLKPAEPEAFMQRLHEVLAQAQAQFVGQRTCQHVGGAAGRERHDQADRLARPGLRHGVAAGHCCGQRNGLDQVTTVEFVRELHGCLRLCLSEA